MGFTAVTWFGWQLIRICVFSDPMRAIPSARVCCSADCCASASRRCNASASSRNDCCAVCVWDRCVCAWTDVEADMQQMGPELHKRRQSDKMLGAWNIQPAIAAESRPMREDWSEFYKRRQFHHHSETPRRKLEPKVEMFFAQRKMNGSLQNMLFIATDIIYCSHFFDRFYISIAFFRPI
jgi:hypothetical protein